MVLRVKRGLVYTSQNGGLYKDKMYLEGALEILQYRHEIDFRKLLCGKISLKDYLREDIEHLINCKGTILPSFMINMNTYHQCLDAIAYTNFVK